MEPFVFLAVLVAALCHASWNALVKLKLEPLQSITLVSVAAGVLGLPFVISQEFPAAAAWPYLIGSLIIHLAYYLALAEAYRSGDLGQVYPIARGSAPLMTAIGAKLAIGENLPLIGWLGLLCLTFGVILLSLRGGRSGTGFQGRPVLFALLTALTIAMYSIVDGLGGRASGDVLGYIGWLMFLDGVMMLIFGLIMWRGRLWTMARDAAMPALGGGALAFAGYGIAIWAMTKAPIAVVAALRETSVLFAALIGMMFLKEPLVPIRIVAAAIVFAGAAMLRLS